MDGVQEFLEYPWSATKKRYGKMNMNGQRVCSKKEMKESPFQILPDENSKK